MSARPGYGSGYGSGSAAGAGWLVIGLGNADRGDDGAGIEVARRLAASGLPAVVHQGDALGLIALWRGYERVIVVDAVVGDIPPGKFARIDVSSQALPAAAHAPGHGVGLDQAIEIARALALLPQALIVYAIGARTVALGSGPAPAGAAACAEAAGDLRREVRATATT